MYYKTSLNIILSYLTILVLVVSASTLSQVKNCAYCNKKLEGNYIQADNLFYHPEHFLCAHCDKPIEGSFNKSESKYYHTYCMREFVVPKCGVCGEPLEGHYFQDLYGYKYHDYHVNSLFKCDNCDRLICDRITKGGKTFSDGRHLCNICLENSVKSESTYKYLLNKVSSKLKGLGLYIDMGNVTVNAVDRDGLKKVIGKSYNIEMKGFCRITTETITNNHKSKTTKQFDIFVLNMIPQIYIETTLAHELMHVWLEQNTHNKHSDDLEEGSCHFIAYKYLNLLNNSDSENLTKFMMNDISPVYGEGFRKVFTVFNNRYLVELLNYLKNNKTL